VSKKQPKFTVSVTYDGYDQILDRQLENVAGRMGDSGYGFGQRDLDFDFVQLSAAERCEKRLRSYLRQVKKYRWKVILREVEDA